MSEPVFDPSEILAALHRHGVDHVLIGGLAATLHGSPYVTTDVDVCPAGAAENLERLAAALEDLDARVYSASEPEGLPFERSAGMLERAEVWNLLTRAGRLDISFTPSGTQGYSDLKRDAVRIEVRGIEILVASLADVIRSKEAAGRERDRVVLPTLRRLLDELEGLDR